MRLFEVVCAVAMFTVFSIGALAALKPCMELYEKTAALEEKVDRDSFLSRGFINVCKESGIDHFADDIAEWKEICLSLWPLDSLEYEFKGGFYSQTWKKDGFVMRVECPLEEKNE